METAAYLGFNGNCAEAFRFYESRLGGQILRMVTFGESPMAARFGPEMGEKILHARMTLGRTQLMGSDAPSDQYRSMAGAQVVLLVHTPAEAERLFAALAEGGEVRMPLQETFWSQRFGMVSDRFGTAWMINCETLPAPTEVTLDRYIAAAPARVFAAWAEPARLARWWGPEGFTNPVCEAEVRPGGRMRLLMRAPDGAEYPMTGVFHEVAPPGRLVFTAVARDGAGAPLLESLTEVSFAPEGDGTRLVVRAWAEGFVPVSERMLAGMEAGWSQSLERLRALAEGDGR